MIYEPILIASVWRIASLFVNEDGPFDIFVHIRKFSGVYYDEFSNVHGKNVVSKALLCLWCFSIWVAIPLAFFSKNAVNVPTYVGEVLWLSAWAILIEEVLDRIRGAS